MTRGLVSTGHKAERETIERRGAITLSLSLWGGLLGRITADRPKSVRGRRMKAQRRQTGMMIMPLEARGAEGTRAIINVSFNVSSV
jgi:hypothetical protein